ncbi:MAG: hypothetical protein QME93_00930 [Bacillota bacterium]|nr:hypothetical protein [Bacillota bacterium]MDI7248617.1 hypothetical protein [Bacillota bacterium]
MGEVRVRAILANAVDEALAPRGTMKPDQVRRYEAEACVGRRLIPNPAHPDQPLSKVK